MKPCSSIMMRFLMSIILVAVMVFIFIQNLTLIAGEQDKDKRQTSVSQLTDRPDSTLININNISMWIYADGMSANTPGGSSGAFFPRGNNPPTAVIFQDGIIWGGIVKDDVEPAIRVGGQTYSIGTVPGSIISKGVAEDFTDPSIDRIWRIRRDYRSADLRLDAAELNSKQAQDVTFDEIESVRTRYEKDWIEWPWEKGAPFYDADDDGMYTPQISYDGSPMLFPEADEPGLATADQVVWFVANDLDPGSVQALYGSPAIGLEMQVTLWAYSREDALDNVIFRQYRIIYKSTTNGSSDAKIDSMYLAQWSDPDIGSWGDDLVGCDTSLNVGYAYNSSTTDNVYSIFNLPPPAVGYEIVAGPIIPSPESEAIFGLRKRFGLRNLMITTFSLGLPPRALDPIPGGDYRPTIQWWNILRGYKPRPENPPAPITDPDGNVTQFTFSGDPITGSGWIDGEPGDRRMALVSGPFNMALGDTNEITISLVAGLGSDRLFSISVMKYYSRVAQSAFDNLFVMPEPPPSPKLTASELDGMVLLNWGESRRSVERIEMTDEMGFRFEGYNVYQLSSSDAGIASGIKLMTFDLENEVTLILEEQFDPQIGAVLTVPVQVGKNSHIFRNFLIDKDAQRDNDLLVNGREYFFAVTAYNYNPDKPFGKVSLESEPAVVSVVPHALNPGVRLETAMGDTIAVEHNRGKSEGKVIPVVIDPTKLTGDEYKVTFKEYVEGRVLWSLLNITKGRTLLSEMTNLTGDEDYLITEGVQVLVTGPAPGVKRQDMFDNPDNPELWGWDIPSGERRFSWANADFGFGGFRGAIGWASPHHLFGGGAQGVEADELKPVLLVLAQVDEEGYYDPDDPNVSYAYRYGRLFSNPPARPEFAPFIINPLGGYAFQDYTKSVPLSALDISDADNPRRLVVGHLENNVEGGLVDGKWWPGYWYGQDNVAESGPQEWLWIYDADYREEPNPDFQIEAIDNPLPIMYWLTVTRRSYVPFSPGGTGEDQFAIFPNKPLTENDEFTFHTIAPLFDKTKAKEDVLSQVNVFPNPYYGLFVTDVNRLNRFVTFSHLPEKATIRIFNLAGLLVRTIRKDDESQFVKWDLLNKRGRSVAGGIYIAHIEMPELGVSKILKLAVFHK